MSEILTQEELNKTLWGACDTFRGSMDSSVYKDYILVMLFIKYVSDMHKERKAEMMKKYDGDLEMVERQMSREEFKLDDNSTFDYIYENKNADSPGEIINTALEQIEEANKTKLRGVFKNIDFNSENVLGNYKDRKAKLRNLLEDFAVLDLSPSKLGGKDIIGNAYEYLINKFASDAGKKGGEFFTPSEVSELLASLVKPVENDRIYDPTCGSGSLLIKAFQKVPNGNAQIYGQERNGQTESLCKLNMYLHKIYDAEIEWGDTLANPKHLEDGKLKKFQVVVANPPFSLDKWSMGFAGSESDKDFKMEEGLDPYNRFSWGIPPKSKGDYAFVLHMINSLAAGGRMGVVLPHGVLFRGAAEGKIRKQIIDTNLLDAVIGLPANLFFGTSIPACILILKQNRTTKDILFIDASGEDHYEKGKNQNKLRPEDIDTILKAYGERKDIDKYAHVATIEEVKENDYNLNIPRYVDTFEEEELVDMQEVEKNITSIRTELKEVELKMAEYLKELGL